MDYTNMSLTQAKRLEMESQVKALELEKELEMERTRLAELRKVHYHLAGASEGWEEVSREDALPCKLALPVSLRVLATQCLVTVAKLMLFFLFFFSAGN